MTRFLVAMWDALKHLFANKSARMTMVVSILLYAFIYPQPYTGEVVRELPIAVIDQDGSTASREFLRRVDAADTASVIAVVESLVEAERLFYERKIYGVVLIPPNFERDLLNGHQSPVVAFGDGSYFIIYSGLASAVSNAALSLGPEVRFARLTALGLDEETATTLISPVTIASVPLFNPNSGYASYIVPASFVLIIQQTLLMGIGIIHTGKRLRSGIIAMATPVAYVLLYLVWVAATQLLLPRLYGLPQVGNPLVLLALAIPFLTAVTAFGFALARLIPSREGVMFFLLVQGMPLFFMTGIAWPIESIPEPIHTMALIIPSSSAISAFVRVDQMGADLAHIQPVIMLQLILTLVYGILAYLLNRRRAF